MTVKAQDFALYDVGAADFALYTVGAADILANDPRVKAVTLSKNPLVYWRLNELSGAVAADSSGNGKTGAISGSVTLGVAPLLPGDPNDAGMSFVGGATSNKVTGAVTALGASAPFSFSAWFVPSTLVGNGRIGGVYASNAFLLRVGSALSGRVHDSPDVTITSAAVLTVGGLFHGLVTYDGAFARLYLNGALAAGPTAVASVASSATMIVDSDNASNGFGGSIKDVALFGYALSAADASDIYRVGVSALGARCGAMEVAL